MYISITCVPCEHESKILSVINQSSSMSTSFKMDNQEFFESTEPHYCPFCEMKLEKSTIFKAFVEYFEKENITLDVRENTIEFERKNKKLIMKLNAFISPESFNDEDVRSFFTSRNDYELVRLFVSEINTQQWKITIDNDMKVGATPLICY
ncbi:MAG: hypothetical protein Q8934_18485 [Bacillota bacterium]|nr:hypothetical protein [Bacillota bacterium]